MAQLHHETDVKIVQNWDSECVHLRISTDYAHVRQYKLIDVPGSKGVSLDFLTRRKAIGN